MELISTDCSAGITQLYQKLGQSGKSAHIPYVIESSTVPEHQQDIINKLLSSEVVESVALVQFPADH